MNDTDRAAAIASRGPGVVLYVAVERAGHHSWRGGATRDRGRRSRSRSSVLFACAAALWVLAQPALGETDVIYRKGYVDGRFGQMHYHAARPATATDKAPVVFFHQNPKSSEEYRPVLELVGKSRLALAIDTPGYGESDRPPSPPDMADIAGAMADALTGLGYGPEGKGPVDVFGFHTGVFIASELAIARPELVRRVVLSGVAYVDADERQRYLDELPRDKTLPEDGTFILNRWYLIVINRPQEVPLERAARIFVEDIHSLDKSWYAYHAVWNYAPEERLPLIKQPTLILEPHEMLLEQTLRARKELMPQADLIELPDVVDDVFDTGAQPIADALIRWLDAER